jgi:hypothetical protein
MNNTNGCILVVTDIDENLVLEYVNLDDIRNERLVPIPL